MKLAVIYILLAGCASAGDVFTRQPQAPKIASPKITEASGLATSPRSDDFLWLINDSNGTPEIHLCDTNGKAHGSVTIAGVRNTDWEDLAAFVHKGESYLLVADTGDNQSKREMVSLFIVREPKLPTAGDSVSGEIPVAWRIDFKFEDGPRDCEAVAVDALQEKIILVSKRTKPPVIYELALRPSGEFHMAKRIGTTQTKASAFSLVPYSDQPVGLDISPDGARAAIVTYYGVFLFSKKPEQNWGQAFAERAICLERHRLPQAEAIGIFKLG